MRSSDQHREEWSRYDVQGETLYVAETRQCAYSEVLASYKRRLGTTDPLGKDAAALGMTLEDFVEEVAQQWSERDFMGLGAVPAGWRNDRGVFVIHLPSTGWWIDIEHPDSIAALERRAEKSISNRRVHSLTTAVLRGEDRALTTMLAEYAHDQTLDDGTQARGIHFGSKHGASWCRAVWLDRDSAGEMFALSPDPILVTDDDLIVTADRFRIRVF